MRKVLFLRKPNIRIIFENIPNIDVWLRDFSPEFLASDNYFTIKVAKLQTVLQPQYLARQTICDGKYTIVWYEAPLPTILWQSNDDPATKLLGINKVGKDTEITLQSTSENMLGRWLRHFIVVREYISLSLVFLHATAISRRNKTFIIVGPSGAGKTLCAYSAFRNGWKVLADETLLIKPSLDIVPFFSTVIWDCRLKLRDKELIDRTFPSHKTTTKTIIPRFDYKKRMIFYPQSALNLEDIFPITGIISLQSSNDREEEYIYDIKSIMSEVRNRTSMRSIFDLYGEDYDKWQTQAMSLYSKILSLPIHAMRNTGDLEKDILAFIETINTLSS